MLHGQGLRFPAVEGGISALEDLQDTMGFAPFAHHSSDEVLGDVGDRSGAMSMGPITTRPGEEVLRVHLRPIGDP